MRIGMLPVAGVMLAFLLAGPAEGQLIYVAFKSERTAKRFKQHVITYKGQEVVIGEPKEGITMQGGSVHYTGGGEAKNAMWVGDPGRPEQVPYQLKKGAREASGKGDVIRFAGDEVRHFGVVDQLLTLEGVAAEYRRRVAEIDGLEEQRDGHDKGARPWLGAQGLLVARLDSLCSWLKNMGYLPAAAKLEKRVATERKSVEDAVAEREKTALASVHAVDTPERLQQVAQEVTGGSGSFSVHESQHLRMVYFQEIDSSEAAAALELGERIIEGFRKEFVDPYIDEDYRDYIPDGMFAEFYFGPEDAEIHERMGVEYYKIRWDRNNKERQLKSGGNSFMRGRLGYLTMFQVGAERDLQGTVAHRMGHVLADLHYNGGGQNRAQDWLEEAVGYYLSFNFLGRNTLTCFSWDVGSYAKQARQEAEKTVQAGLKGHFNELALAKGPPIDTLALKELFEIDDADFAKAWSFFDWVARDQGRIGQLWLRRTCAAKRYGGEFMVKWRAASDELYKPEPGADVFALLEERWKKYARDEQLRE